MMVEEVVLFFCSDGTPHPDWLWLGVPMKGILPRVFAYIELGPCRSRLGLHVIFVFQMGKMLDRATFPAQNLPERLLPRAHPLSDAHEPLFVSAACRAFSQHRARLSPYSTLRVTADRAGIEGVCYNRNWPLMTIITACVS